MRACIFGASGGIGQALIAQLVASGEYGQIFAGYRDVPHGLTQPITPFQFDLTDEHTIAAAAQMIAEGGPLDLIIIATGVLQQDGAFTPERSWRAIDANAMAQVIQLNTIGPAMIAKHFLPLLHRDRRAIFAALSARVGSIADNSLGGWHSYRASKAALNMLMRNFAIELKSRNSEAIAVCLHPGTVDTELSKPFQRHVPAQQLFTAQHSAEHLLKVIEGLTANDSGASFAWDGQRIPY